MKKLLLCITAIALISCDIEEEVVNLLGEGTVTANINGQVKTFEFGPNSVAASITSSDTGVGIVYAFGIGASSDGVSNNSETESIGITLIKDSPNFIVAGASFSFPNDALGGTYSYEDENGSTTIDGDETTSATLNISAVSNDRISGSFSFVVVDGDTNIAYTVSNGSFNNIPYYTE